MTSALSTAQIVTIVLTFVSVVSFVVGSAYWLNSSSYWVLYADMDPEAASQLVAQLRSRDVPFRLDDGGRAIRVPSTRIDELRLELAGEGLPASGRIGFEIFDRTAFGVTEFLEHVNYRRALEGEIARTISTLSEVSSARVHIAMAQESLFATRSEPAKASVVLKRRNKQPLSQSAVIGITNLVAASVEGLRAEAVVLLDSFGNPLSRPPGDNDEPLGNAQGERQRRLEADLSNRVVTLLEPVVGLNRVRGDVSARLNPESAELTEERWDPDTVVRSRQVTTEVGTPTLPTSGVAGASANIPSSGDDTSGVAADSTSPARQAALDPPSRGTETTNYEMSKVVRHSVRPRGEIARLSVAVIVDDEHLVEEDATGQTTRSTRPRDADELQKLEGLVAAAVGLDTGRGDLLTVENIAFEIPEFEEPEPPSAWQTWSPQIIDGARILAVIVLGLVAFFFVLRPLMKRVVVALPTAGAVPVLPDQLPRTLQDLEGDLEAELDSVTGTNRKMPILTKRLTEMTSKSPENAARLLRTWLADEER